MEKPEAFQKCIAMIAVGSDAAQRGRFPMADSAFKAALVGTEYCTPDEASSLVPLIQLNQAFLLQKQGRSQEAEELRAQATTRLEAITTPHPLGGYVYLTAVTLQRIGDYGRAIPYWEQAIQASQSDSDGIASMLHRLGECYSRIGLRDHAVIPVRAALKLLEFCHEDPRRSALLVTLGNVLRKSDPGEAEACYKEAAEVHASRLQYQAAAPAWGNLGTICSEQGRFEEALEYYQKVLRVRQQSPGPQRLAVTHNNIALCYMRMKKFSEAHESIDRAIQLMTDKELATIYSSKGMIYQASGQPADAVEWLRRAISEWERQPSPNLESMAEDLDREIAALGELGRGEEAAVAKAALDKVRGRMSEMLAPNVSMGAAHTPLQGAVTIEITHPNGQNPFRDDINFKKLELSLMYDAEEDKTGHLSGVVKVPGTTTLIFYASDSEALYRALEPRLHSSPLLASATVTIRQGKTKRQVILPGQGLRPN